MAMAMLIFPMMVACTGVEVEERAIVYAPPNRFENARGAIAKRKAEEAASIEEQKVQAERARLAAERALREADERNFLEKVKAGTAKRLDFGEGVVLDLIKVRGKTEEYFLGRYEVTQKQYLIVMGKNPSHYKGADWATHPVERVSRDDAMAFCNVLNEALGKEMGDYVFTLPTGAQWENAARAGGKTLYAGSDNLDEVAWFGENSGRHTHAVGMKKANGFGFHDMSGNTWEWCLGMQMSSVGLRCARRGGSWGSGADDCRINYLFCGLPGFMGDDGFRVAACREKLPETGERKGAVKSNAAEEKGKQPQAKKNENLGEKTGHRDAVERNRPLMEYTESEDVQHERAKAMGWLAVEGYRWAAEQGDAAAQCNIGWLYENGKGVERNYTTAIKWYLKSAMQGNAAAQNHLGGMYYRGHGVKRDYSVAMEWFLQAARQDDAVAQANIGWMYLHGHGVERDYAAAMEWYLKAAEQGEAVSQHNIAMMYFNGHGVERDYKMAMNWFLKAARHGYGNAQCNIGYMYMNGWGVERDYAKAMEWFKKAAEQGNGTALNNVGSMYEKGFGVERNYDMAFQWYAKAAVKNLPAAQYALGLFYEKGLAVEKDLAKAKEWYKKAAEQKLEDAEEALARLNHD